MRRILLALAVIVCPRAAHAQETSAAGWIGAGMFGDEAAATVDLGFDVDGHGASLGMGGRLRWLSGGGVRSEDWDELSEWVGVIRYFTWVTHPADQAPGPAEDGDTPPPPPGQELRGALAIGRLGGATLGHGSVIDGFTTGLDVDHGQIGAQVRVQRGELGGEALIDDMVSPRIVGLRGHARLQSGVEVGLSAAGDGAVPMMTGSRSVLFLVADAEVRAARRDGRADGRLYADLVGVYPFAGGLHLGAAGTVALGSAGTRAGLRAEGRAGTAGYLPGWIGPLYQRLRADELTRAADGELAGFGGLGELSVEDARVGGASLSVARRAGQPWLATGRLSAPSFRGVQAALWAAAEIGGADAFAMEARARLPGAMFAVVEMAHLFRGSDMGPVPIWIATAAVGGVLGE